MGGALRAAVRILARLRRRAGAAVPGLWAFRERLRPYPVSGLRRGVSARFLVQDTGAVPVMRFSDDGDRVHDRARRGRRDPESSRESGGAIPSRPAGRGDPPHHLLTPSRPRPPVQSVVIEAAVGRGAGVRSALCRDALSRTPGSAVSDAARGMRAHLGPRISASTPSQAGAERKEIPIPTRWSARRWSTTTTTPAKRCSRRSCGSSRRTWPLAGDDDEAPQSPRASTEYLIILTVNDTDTPESDSWYRT